MLNVRMLVWRTPQVEKQAGERSVLLRRLGNLEDRLELLDQSPLVHGDVRAVEFLQRVDACTRNVRVQHVLLLEVSAVHRLVAGFDLDGHGRLALFADGDGLVFALDRYTVVVSLCCTVACL